MEIVVETLTPNFNDEEAAEKGYSPRYLGFPAETLKHTLHAGGVVTSSQIGGNT